MFYAMESESTGVSAAIVGLLAFLGIALAKGIFERTREFFFLAGNWVFYRFSVYLDGWVLTTIERITVAAAFVWTIVVYAAWVIVVYEIVDKTGDALKNLWRSLPLWSILVMCAMAFMFWAEPRLFESVYEEARKRDKRESDTSG